MDHMSTKYVKYVNEDKRDLFSTQKIQSPSANSTLQQPMTAMASSASSGQ